MKLSASNIAWTSEYDHHVYKKLAETGCTSIEIAPTRLVGSEPYTEINIKKSSRISKLILKNYGLRICSVQSLWFGVKQRIFSCQNDRNFLIDYTERALNYAAEIGASNVVFGCPSNRQIIGNEEPTIAIDFFSRCAELASQHDITFAMEANPKTYGTNFLNKNVQVYEFINKVNHQNLTMNYDIGSVIENKEKPILLERILPKVSHVHFSGPHLRPVINCHIYSEIASILRNAGYKNYVSLEMREAGISNFFSSIQLMQDIFRG
jgi:sugar phosphate isomerase/epimerase